jgi:hypothetical protein
MKNKNVTSDQLAPNARGAKAGKTAATPSKSKAVGKSKSGAGDLPEDELSKIVGGTQKLPDSY